MVLESEVKFRQANDLEVKLTKANAEIESKALEFKNMEKHMTEQRMKIDSSQALIDGLTSEKNHLELSWKESED